MMISFTACYDFGMIYALSYFMQKSFAAQLFMVMILFTEVSSSETLTQPIVETPRNPSSVRVGQSADIEIIVRWEGAPDAFVVFPIECPQLDWGTAEVIRTAAEAEDSGTVVTQTLQVIAKDAGRFEIPPLRIEYAAKEQLDAANGAAPVRDVLEGEKIVLEAKAPGRVSTYILGAVAVFALGLTVAALAWLRRGRQAGGGPALSPMERVSEALHAARRYRLDGDFYAFYRMLGEAIAQMPADSGAAELKKKYEARSREVGYQGVRPTEDQLEGDLRDLERALAHWKETTAS